MRDLVADVLVEMRARAARSVLIMLAVALSIGALLASVGFSSTAARQVEAEMAASGVSLVTVGAAAGATGEEEIFPGDAVDRATRLDLVAAAGLRLDLDHVRPTEVRRGEVSDTGPVAGISVAGLTPGYLAAAGVVLPGAQTWLLEDPGAVAFLGAGAAEALDIPVTPDPTGYSVDIDGRRHAVVGFLGSGDGSVDLSGAVVVPYQNVRDAVGSDVQAVMLVRAEVGAGSVVSRVIRTAVRPDAPERLAASQVVDRSDLRADVSAQLGRLALGVGGLLLVLTVLLIANTMVVSVMSRNREIGLRRAIGYGRADVAALFLCEGALTGLLGGLAGAAFATVAVVVVAAVNGWTPVLAPWASALGPVIGALTGLLSSAYPASRAAVVEPAIAVRSD